MKKTSSLFSALTTLFVTDMFDAREREFAAQRIFVGKVMTSCPGALEALCEKRFDVCGIPHMPTGNPVSQCQLFEDLIKYFSLVFTLDDVLHMDGGGQVGYWSTDEKKWVITIDDLE